MNNPTPATTLRSIYGPACPSEKDFICLGHFDSATIAHLEQLLTQVREAAQHLMSDLFAQVNGEWPLSSPERLEQDRRRARLEEAQMHLAQFEAIAKMRILR